MGEGSRKKYSIFVQNIFAELRNVFTFVPLNSKNRNKMTPLQAGTVVTFTPTGKQFQIKTATDKKVVWWLDFQQKSLGRGINTMKTASTSRRIFEEGIQDGTYKIN